MKNKEIEKLQILLTDSNYKFDSIFQLANDHINRDLTQDLFDLANYTIIAKNGDVVVKEVKESLSNYFIQKQAAAYVSLYI